MPGHDAQMLKGVLGLLLLRLLAAREDYGYSLVLRLQEHGFAELAEGTVYPALTRLESQGLLEARLVRSTSGPARKYYRPTEAGLAELARAGRAWRDLAAAVARVVGGGGDDTTDATTEGTPE
jgi:PadR family transcriptional regulator PadR